MSCIKFSPSKDLTIHLCTFTNYEGEVVHEGRRFPFEYHHYLGYRWLHKVTKEPRVSWARIPSAVWNKAYKQVRKWEKASKEQQK